MSKQKPNYISKLIANLFGIFINQNFSIEPIVTNNQTKQEIERNQGQGIGQMNGSKAYYLEGDVHVHLGNPASSNNISPAEFSLPKKIVTIPQLLPYLANRSEQKFQLETTIKAHLKQSPNKLLICIIHGDEFQCHDKFLERMTEKYLPRIFELDATKNAIQEYDLSYPLGVKQPKEFKERLCHELGEIIEQDSSASIEKINQTFCQYPCPIIVHTHLLTRDWEDKEVNLLDNLLTFWNDWPELAVNQQLIVCISIKYELNKDKSKEYQNDKFLWLLKILDFLRIRKSPKFYRDRKLNKIIARQLDEISQSKFDSYQNLNGVVLSELPEVNRSDVEIWARKYTIDLIGQEGLDKLLIYIRDMFHKREKDESSSTIPMEDLAQQLKSGIEYSI